MLPVREEVVLPAREEYVLPVREEYVLPVLFLFRPIPAEITSGRRDKGNQQAAHLHTMPKGYPAPYVPDDKKDKKEYPAGIS